MNLIEKEIRYVIATEIYPKIIVYNQVLKDPEKIYDILKRSGNSENELFETWKEWYTFGEIIQNLAASMGGIQFDRSVDFLKVLNCKNLETDLEKDQKYLMENLIEAFHLVNSDYLKRLNFELDLNEKVRPTYPQKEYDMHTSFPESVEKYIWDGPSFCKYYPEGRPDMKDLAMQFHSDHIMEELPSEGYKFFLTTTTYFNDDYEGGEIVFAVGDSTVEYKPKMGDIIVFPSGHPNYLTENNSQYFHAVKKVYKKEKYFSRMYWKVFEHGTEEFFKMKNELTEEEIRKNQKDYTQKVYQPIQEKYGSISGLENTKGEI